MTEQHTDDQRTTDQHTPDERGQNNTDSHTDSQNEQRSYRSQEDFDKAISARLGRERKKWDQEKAEIERKAKMDEHERTKAEKEESDRKAREAAEALDRYKVLHAAERQAVKLGGKPIRAEQIVALAWPALSSVEVGDSGPDATAVEAAIKAVLEDVPELKATTTGSNLGGSGSNPGVGSDSRQTVEKNPFSREHLNLTEQARILGEDPELAARLRKEAQV